MKLTDLNPRWILGHQYIDSNGTINVIGNNPNHGRHGMGLSFDCPIHHSHRLAIFFANPVDGKPPTSSEKFLWNRSGETFDSMSIAPSIDASNLEFEQSQCWHGFITQGDVK